MKALVVEDDFISRALLQKLLAKHGACDVAINGNEALAAFNLAAQSKVPYDLICLDIMMPGIDGLDTLKQIRLLEEQAGIGGLAGVKVLMTTALTDKRSVLNAFKEGCEAYLPKPIEEPKLLAQIRALGLLSSQAKK